MKRTSVLKSKLQITFLLTMVYLLGRNIPVPGVVQQVDEAIPSGIQPFINGLLGTQTLTSIFALGLMPWMTASIIVQLFHTATDHSKSKTSANQLARTTALLTLVIAIVQATIRVADMDVYLIMPRLVLIRAFVITVLVAGSMLVSWIAHENQKLGLGGPTFIILVNILSEARKVVLQFIYVTFTSPDGDVRRKITIAMICGLIVIFAAILLEKAELRIAVKRIMIDNLYSDDYIAIRMNPAGSMPIMYVMSFFALPYYICTLLQYFFPENMFLSYSKESLNTGNAVGIFIFTLMLWGLTFALSFLYINPKNITEQLEQYGDYIEGYYPGKETETMLRRHIVFAGVAGSFCMSVIIVGPMIYKMVTGSTDQIYQFPMTLFIMTGILLNIFDEVIVIRNVEHYKPFL